MKHYLKPLILLPISTFLVSCVSFRMPSDKSLYSYIVKFEGDKENRHLSSCHDAQSNELYFPLKTSYSESNEYSISQIDNEYIDSFDSNTKKYYGFTKCTFVLHNYAVGSRTYYSINISVSFLRGSDDCSDILRVRVYDNPVFGDHDFTTYAKARSDGQNEYISDANRTLATRFLTEKNIISLNDSLYDNESRRYTLITWLEGSDPDCTGVQLNASFVLNVDIQSIS